MTERIEIRAAGADGIAALSALPGFRAGTLRLPCPNPDQTRTWLEARPKDGFSIVAITELQFRRGTEGRNARHDHGRRSP